MRPEAQYNSWARQILWANTLPDACPAASMDAASDACVAWVLGFQRDHGLLPDGMLGPTTLQACMSIFGQGGRWSGPGPAILGGQEIDLGWPVWRMPTLGRVEQGPALRPDLIALLSIGELDRVARRRVLAKSDGLRCHFSIDGARGVDGHALVLQWADPLLTTPFCPATQLGDYPIARAAVGVEVEDPLAPHYREREGKTRGRMREMTTAHIAGQSVRQLNLFPEQTATLTRLLAALCDQLQIPFAFPRLPDGSFDTQCDPQKIEAFKGIAARFHWHVRASEPGAGVVEILPSLFGQGGPPKEKPPAQPPPRPAEPRAVVLDRITDAERERLNDSWAQGATTAAGGSLARFEAKRFSVDRVVRASRQDPAPQVEAHRAEQVANLRARLRPHLRYPA